MKTTIQLLVAFACLSIINLNAQNISINGTGATAHPSALLDIDAASTPSLGLLIPRIALQAINVAAPVTSPATSLLVYNTASASTGTNAVSPGYYHWDGAKWVRFAYNSSGSSSTAWDLLGNAGTTASTNFMGTTDAQDLVLKTNNTEKMRVLSNGNVGIGVTNPTYKLDVNFNDATILTPTNNATWRGSKVENTSSVNGSSAGVILRSNTFDAGIFAITNSSFNGGRLAFVTDNPQDEKMTILGNNVGIGTNNPTNHVDVNSGFINVSSENQYSGHTGHIYSNVSSSHAPLFIGSRARGTALVPTHILNNDAIVYFEGRSEINNTDGSSMRIISTENQNATSAGSKITFNTIPNGSLIALERMTIGNDGNVGIGTSMNLDARTTISGGQALPGGWSKVLTLEASHPAIQFKSTNTYTQPGVLGGSAWIEYDDAWPTAGFGGLSFRVADTLNQFNTSNRAMIINKKGNVGIGTTSPTAQLSVNGSANNTTGVWGIFSDARIKTVNGNFTDGLNVIKKINTVKFTYNANAPFKSNDEQIGIVAQELEKIAPYMVTKVETNDIKDLREVNPQAYIFLLINAIKELDAKNEQQQKQNSLLQKQIDELKGLIKK